MTRATSRGAHLDEALDRQRLGQRGVWLPAAGYDIHCQRSVFFECKSSAAFVAQRLQVYSLNFGGLTRRSKQSDAEAETCCKLSPAGLLSLSLEWLGASHTVLQAQKIANLEN